MVLAALGASLAALTATELIAGINAGISGSGLVLSMFKAKKDLANQRSSLDKLNMEAGNRAKLETMELEKRRAMNYSRAEAYGFNSRQELGQFDLAMMNRGLDINSPFQSERRLQMQESQERTKRLIRMGQA